MIDFHSENPRTLAEKKEKNLNFSQKRLKIHFLGGAPPKRGGVPPLRGGVPPGFGTKIPLLGPQNRHFRGQKVPFLALFDVFDVFGFSKKYRVFFRNQKKGQKTRFFTFFPGVSNLIQTHTTKISLYFSLFFAKQYTSFLMLQKPLFVTVYTKKGVFSLF